MEDWNARLDALEPRLAQWNRTFALELGRVCKERRLVGWFKRPTQVELDAAAIEARRRAGVEVLADVAALCDALCDHYPTCLPQEQCKIRAEVGSHEAFFDEWWGYVESFAARIKKPGDAPSCSRAFVAIAIDDLRADVLDLNRVMKRVILAAATAGIDWRAAIAAAAKVANRSTGGGGAQMREFLEAFEHSNYFKEHVVKELAAARRRALGMQSLGADR